MLGIHSGSAVVKRPQGREDVRLFRHVMVCLDRSANSAHILEEALSLATLAGAAVTVMRVVPGGPSTIPCADPVDWELTRRAEIADLRRMAEAVGATTGFHAIVVCGSAARCVLEEAHRREVDLLVVGAGAFGTPHQWGLGGTARHIAETFRGSVLVVPDRVAGEPDKTRRIIVPMDGSSPSEAALRYADAIAQGRAAELVVLHAVPEIGPLQDARAGFGAGPLWRELREEAEHTAEERLRHLRRLLPPERTGDRIRQLSGDEPRRALMQAICEERGELVVLSARGHGRDPDLPIGSTAEYLLSRAVTPVLLIRNAEMTSHRSGGPAPGRSAAAWQGR